MKRWGRKRKCCVVWSWRRGKGVCLSAHPRFQGYFDVHFICRVDESFLPETKSMDETEKKHNVELQRNNDKETRTARQYKMQGSETLFSQPPPTNVWTRPAQQSRKETKSSSFMSGKRNRQGKKDFHFLPLTHGTLYMNDSLASSTHRLHSVCLPTPHNTTPSSR
jgi:hypothetical protein